MEVTGLPGLRWLTSCPWELGCVTVWGRALSRCDFVVLWLCQPKPSQGRQLSRWTIS